MTTFKFYRLGFLLFLFSMKSFADFKNETIKVPAPCLFRCILEDGFYIGISAGYDIYEMRTKPSPLNVLFDDTFTFANNINLNAEGVVGGAYFGYGRDFPGFYHTYLGIEAFGFGSAASSGYELTSNHSIYETTFQGKNNFGISIIPGIKLVKSTLIYAKLGYVASKINVTETFITDGLVVDNNNEVPMVYGWNTGIGIENAFFDDFSIRAEYNYQWFNSFKTEVGTKITPSNGEFMLGLSYRIIL